MYIKNSPNISAVTQQKLDEKFNKKYFSVWDQKNSRYSKKDASWGLMYAKSSAIVAENYKPIPPKWFELQIKNSNFEKFNTLRKKAITISNSSSRVFPSFKPFFKNPKNAGEGFPFDYNQNSGIKINTPLLVSHFSLDKAWAFVESSYTSGWISVLDIAFVDDDFIKRFKTKKYAIAIKDDFPIYSDKQNKIYLETIKLGTIIPLYKHKLIVAQKDKHGNGHIKYINIQPKTVAIKPIKINRSTLTHIVNELINKPYGWADMLGNRDCSSSTQDFFSVFGIYLPRNSSNQKNSGEYISLKEYSAKQKKELIIQNAIPFFTLLYKRGHIMLYIGHKDGEPIIFHNTWGIKTLHANGTKGRHIIGKSILSTLELGSKLQNSDPKSTLINKIEGMTILTKTPSTKFGS